MLSEPSSFFAVNKYSKLPKIITRKRRKMSASPGIEPESEAPIIQKPEAPIIPLDREGLRTSSNISKNQFAHASTVWHYIFARQIKSVIKTNIKNKQLTASNACPCKPTEGSIEAGNYC